MNLNELRDEALRIATEHGFKDATIGEDIALMHSELSEALEEFRAGKIPINETHYEAKDGQTSRERTAYFAKPVGIPSELADVIIRILHFSGKHKIDIARAVAEKMHFNETRPFRHGDKKL